ncbi:MAG: DUF4837 family protein [Bacteroidales bacterium]
MKKSFEVVAALLVISSFLFSCHKKEGNADYKPSPVGQYSELSIVIPTNYWEGALGNELRTIFSEDVPFLPQSEPMFDISQIPPLIFKDAFLKTRNVLVVQIDPKYTEPMIATANDVFARPQSLAYLNADSPAAAIEYIKTGADIVIDYFLTRNRDAQIETNKSFNDIRLEDAVKKMFDIDITARSGYRLANLPEKSNDFMWLDFNGSLAHLGLFIYTYPYTNQEMFSKAAIIEKRNELLQKYVGGEKDGSYMTTEVQLQPSLDTIDFKGSYAVEMRGLWKMHNDFLGGPFVSLTVLDEKKTRLVTVEGFVSAHAAEKRDYMRQLEAIVYSLSLEDAATVVADEE